MPKRDAMQSDRLLDLVRHQRGELYDAGLITDAEYAALSAIGAESARRLETYDELREKLEATEASHADEETAHQDTLRLLSLRDAEIRRLTAENAGLAAELKVMREFAASR